MVVYSQSLDNCREKNYNPGMFRNHKPQFRQLHTLKNVAWVGSSAQKWLRSRSAPEEEQEPKHDLNWEDSVTPPEEDENLIPFPSDLHRDEEMARLEAILFIAREPLPSRKLAQLAELSDGTRTRTLIRELNRRYDLQPCAFRVFEVAGGFQLRTRPQFAPWLCRLQDIPVEIRLSGPALETLSIVAFKQPVLRAEVEAVRGVQCGELLRQLMEQDLVRIAGRSEELGRPFLYGTTRRFLQVFGLNRLEDLRGEG